MEDLDEEVFEDEVRRVARELWPRAQYDGAQMVDGRERDGVFITEDNVHLIESTVSRTKEKAVKDINKLVTLAEKLRKSLPTKAVKGWFVTRDEPTADQRGVGNSHGGLVVTLSYSQFRARLIDVSSYLELRSNYRFGSARDPETGDYKNAAEFVRNWANTARGDLGPRELASALLEGDSFVLLGDYGAGKSMTMREIWRDLRARVLHSRTTRFPVLLNLRDHHGQDDPSEALERHAKKLGYSPATHLVRAWRAGYVTLMLDGFDEIGNPGWARQTKKLRDVRHRSMELIRAFVADTPAECGLIVSGREHFFDSPDEMRCALGIGRNFFEARLTEFTDDQIKEYLGKRGWKGGIPAWLPARPLLLGYLASRGLLKETLDVSVGSSPAAGWNVLLDRIGQRESEIEPGMDGDTVRRIIERAATMARRDPDGLGPVSFDELNAAFLEECGYPPDDKASVLLLRLPGLGVRNSEDGSRAFVDREFASAARAGDIARFIADPYSNQIRDPSNWQCCLGELGAEVAALRLDQLGVENGCLTPALKVAANPDQCGALAADVFAVMLARRADYLGSRAYIRDAFVQSMSFDADSPAFSEVTFQDCLFKSLDLAPDAVVEKLPVFERCYIGTLEGRLSRHDLPSPVFGDDTIIEGFAEGSQATAQILELHLPLGTRVLLTILRKLFMQRGSGRKENALFRGLDHRAKRLVPDVLNLLQGEKIASPARVGESTIWYPDRSQSGRVRALLAAPTATTDNLARKAALLGQ